MWRLIEASIRYHAPALAVAWAVAIGVAGLIHGLRWIAEGWPGLGLTGFLAGLFLAVASMVVGFIVQGIEKEEKRTRLHMQLPFTRLQVALARVAVPLLLLAVGVAAGIAVAVAAGRAGAAPRGLSAAHTLLVLGAQFAFYLQIPALLVEAGHLRERRGAAAAAAVWLLTALGVVAAASFQLDVLKSRAAAPFFALAPATAAVFVVVMLFVRRRSFLD